MDVGEKPVDLHPQDAPPPRRDIKRGGRQRELPKILVPREKGKEKLEKHLQPLPSSDKNTQAISDLAAKQLLIPTAYAVKLSKDFVNAIQQDNLPKAQSVLKQIQALDPIKQGDVLRLVNDIDVFSECFEKLQQQDPHSPILNSLIKKMYEHEGVIVASNETEAQARLKKSPGSYVLYPTPLEPHFPFKMITTVEPGSITISLSNNSPREIKMNLKELFMHKINGEFLSKDPKVVEQSKNYMHSLNKPCFLLSRRPDGALIIDYRGKDTLQSKKGTIQQKQVVATEQGFAFADTPGKAFLTIDKLLESIGLQRNDSFLIRKQMLLRRLGDIAKWTPEEHTTYIKEFRHYLDETTLHQLRGNADPRVQSFLKVVEAPAEQRSEQNLVDAFLAAIQRNQYDAVSTLAKEIQRSNLMTIVLRRLDSASLNRLLKNPNMTNFLHEGILSEVKQEGRWCENESAMEQALNQDPDKYFVRQSTDPDSWTVAIQHNGRAQLFRIKKTVFIGMRLSGLSAQALRQKFIEQLERSSTSSGPPAYYWAEPPVHTLFHACLDNSYPEVLKQLMSGPDASRMKVALEDIIPFITAFNPTAAKFLQRVVADFDAISNFPDAARHKLTPLEILRISIIAETALAQGGNEAIYLKKGAKGLPRGLIIDLKEKRFFILSKKHGELQASGTFKKVDDVVGVKIQEVGRQVRAEARHYVRVINKRDEELDDKECAIEQDVSPDDVHLILNYTKTTEKPGKEGQKKTVMIQEAYDGDLFSFAEKSHSNTELLTVFSDLGDSLQKLHAKGYIHDDLKLENALFRQRGETIQVKISDFGCTSNPRRGNPRIASSHRTPRYTAPECIQVLQGVKRMDDPTQQGQAEDMFALGCMMYEILFRAQTPWGALLDEWMRKGEGSAQACYDRFINKYNGFKQTVESLPENSLLRSYCALCADLLNPDPAQRPTAAAYQQKMAELSR